MFVCLHRALNKPACPHSPPLYIQNTCYMTVEKYADHHKTSQIDLKLERHIFVGIILHIFIIWNEKLFLLASTKCNCTFLNSLAWTELNYIVPRFSHSHWPCLVSLSSKHVAREKTLKTWWTWWLEILPFQYVAVASFFDLCTLAKMINPIYPCKWNTSKSFQLSHTHILNLSSQWYPLVGISYDGGMAVTLWVEQVVS